MSERVFSQTFGVCAALIEKGGKFLLVKEVKEIAKNQWNHPAGWIEVGEDPIEGVKREVKEETGYDFVPEYVLGVYSFYKSFTKLNIAPHAIKIVFLGRISERPTGKLADDVSEAKWFTAEEIKNMDSSTLRDLDIKKMMEDYLLGRRYPLDILTHTIDQI